MVILKFCRTCTTHTYPMSMIESPLTTLEHERVFRRPERLDTRTRLLFLCRWKALLGMKVRLHDPQQQQTLLHTNADNNATYNKRIKRREGGDKLFVDKINAPQHNRHVWDNATETISLHNTGLAPIVPHHHPTSTTSTTTNANTVMIDTLVLSPCTPKRRRAAADNPEFPYLER